jgi:creatinine amidohydrolase/Fe(II)-dependent formamide hydrolase-like protein
MAHNGVIGDPAVASAEKGRVILDANIARIADVLRHIIEIDVGGN